MRVMNVHGMWLRRWANCAYCTPPNLMNAPGPWRIEKYSEAIRTTLVSYRQNKGTWLQSRTWHIECWVAQLRKYLEEHPVETRTPVHTGRKSLDLTDVQKRRRKSLLIRGYQIKKEKLKFVRMGWMWKLDELSAKTSIIIAKLEEVGGLPRRGWPN